MNSKEIFLRKSVKPIINFLKKTKVTAEALTLFRIVAGIVVALILFAGDYTAVLIAIIIYQFILILDYVDGPLARYRKNFKVSWVYLDHMTHIMLSFLFLLAITASYYLQTGISLFLALGFVAITSLLFTNIFNLKAFLATRFNKVKKSKSEESTAYKIFSSIFKIEEPFSLFFFLIILDLRGILISLYALVYVLAMFYKLVMATIILENEEQKTN